MKKVSKLLSIAAVSCLTLASFTVSADEKREYEVSITNLTKGVYFTPFLAATHNKKQKLFNLGRPASENLVAVAEAGDISGLKDELSRSPNVAKTAATEGLLAPGDSVKLKISAYGNFKRLSLVSMLLPTNDTMVALTGDRLPRKVNSYESYLMNAYDAGSEMNDELCMSIPGPQCGGAALSPEDQGEGYVYPSPGIHGEGELSRAVYQWDGPVAKVVVKRVR